MPETVLIVDDDPVELRTTDAMVSNFGYNTVTAHGGDAALELLDDNSKQIDCVVLDLVMPDLDGLGVLARMRKAGCDIPVIVQTAPGGLDNIASAIRAGAADFVTKPICVERLKVSLRNVLSARVLASELRRMKPNGALKFNDLLARSQAMQAVIQKGLKAAVANTPLLLEGEAGTGKKSIARAIHGSSVRQDKPFIAIDCGSAPNLVETVIEANGGTLFLDEVAKLTLSAQLELLHVLNGDLSRVTGVRIPKIDVRIISATARNLLAEVKAGRFREDLFYRLHVTSILLPPLRRRAEDIPLLVRHFLARITAEQGRPSCSISTDALVLLTRHRWPENLRELEHTIRHAMMLADGNEICVDAFAHIAAQIEHQTTRDGFSDETFVDVSPAIVSSWPEAEDAPHLPTPAATSAMLQLTDADGEVRPLEEIENEVIRFALAHYGGQMSEAARRLKIGRSTLYRKLETN
jgi:DNA-binding NtrC family response regulator